MVMVKVVLQILCLCAWQVFTQEYADEQNATLQRLEKLEQSLMLHKQRILSLKDVIKSQRSLIHEQENIIQDLEEQIGNKTNLNISQQSRVSAPEKMIAFSVTGHVYSTSQRLKDTTINVYYGQGYNNQTGVFTCPKPGMYFFQFIVKLHQESELHSGLSATLMVNGCSIVSAVVDTFHRYKPIQGGNCAFVRLNVGDQVWLSAEGDTDSLYPDTSFMGAYFSR